MGPKCPAHRNGRFAGQTLNNKLADIVYDPFTPQEQNESGGELLAHYQSTLIDGNSFYMMQKSGRYPSCQPAGILGRTACPADRMRGIGSMECRALRLARHNPVVAWTFLPIGSRSRTAQTSCWDLVAWEDGSRCSIPRWRMDFLYVPGAAGTIWKVNLLPARRSRTSIRSLAEVNHRSQHVCLGPADGRCQRQHLLQRHRTEYSMAIRGTKTMSLAHGW